MGLKASGFRFRGLGHRVFSKDPYTLHPALRIRVVQGCKAQFRVSPKGPMVPNS